MPLFCVLGEWHPHRHQTTPSPVFNAISTRKSHWPCVWPHSRVPQENKLQTRLRTQADDHPSDDFVSLLEKRCQTLLPPNAPVGHGHAPMVAKVPSFTQANLVLCAWDTS
jgi:hypothetical protein